MALSDFWELKDNQVLDGSAILNVYHCKRILAGANANSIGQAFIKTIVTDELKALQDDTLTRTSIDVRNLGDVTDFISIDSSTLPGTRSGQFLTTFNAAAIRFARTRTDMRNGHKRYTVGVETDANDGTWTAAFNTLLASLATALINPWEEVAAPGVDVCDLVILKRFCVVPAQDPCLQYRLPETDAEVDANHYNPTNAIVKAHITSQVSRKHLF